MMETPKNTFCKEERLCSKLVIDQLFTEKKSCFGHPFRFIFLTNPIVQSKYPCQVMFSVPKRNFKHAVTRNLIKRKMREAYRLNKHNWYHYLAEKEVHVALLIVYIEKEILEYASIEKGLLKGLDKVKTSINKP